AGQRPGGRTRERVILQRRRLAPFALAYREPEGPRPRHLADPPSPHRPNHARRTENVRTERCALSHLRRALALDVHPQAHERLADDARDLHLRYADAARDLRLREVLLEAQAEHLAVARREHLHRVVE